ncbi:hypothetical protein Bca52824_030298 [Brassica carinata]|uniref:Uncharacterized protein n=1 Tax=Brassica carinata TaxID=52824 RepID=A0A8X7S8X8_BRACI|nr:hypothetical protein Bca52824_030298 [Brassica carinata]
MPDSDVFGTGQGRQECLCSDKGSVRCVGLWSEDEEDLFHKVVYSYPVSLGRDFLKHLKATFPSRTMKELVSYYFSVIILRRRGIQNRLKSLDVDSDDDE